MALTLKKFAFEFIKLPGTILSGISDLLFGVTEKDKEGKIKEHEGLFGALLNALKFVTKGVSNLIRPHKQTIAVAFWISLLVAGSVALDLFLFPAVLASVAAFSVFGLSIAGIVGANALLQISFAAGLAAAAASLATYAIAGVVNAITAVKNYFSSTQSSSTLSIDSDEDHGIDGPSSAKQMKPLNSNTKSPHNPPMQVPPKINNPTALKVESSAEHEVNVGPFDIEVNLEPNRPNR